MLKRALVAGIAICVFLIASAVLAAEPFWAQATFVSGKVGFLPAGTKAEHPLKRGAVLHKGDRVQAAPGGRASFLLSNGSILVVGEGTQAVIEEAAQPQENASLKAVAKNLSKMLLSREGDNPMLKHLGGLRGEGRNLALAPNKTKVRAPVLLLWLAKPGASSYAVTLMAQDGTLSEESVAGISLEVSASRLKPGATYYWEVRDASAKDTFTPLGSGTFSVLEKAGEEEVRTLEAGIASAFAKAGPSEEPTRLFLLYQIYREHGLGLEALGILDRMGTSAPADDELLRWKRDLMEEMGLREEDLRLVFGAGARG